MGRCSNIQDDIVFIAAKQKPKSNEPTVLKSSSMETAILKNDAQAIQNQSLTAGGCDVDLPADMFTDFTDTLIMTVGIIKIAPN